MARSETGRAGSDAHCQYEAASEMGRSPSTPETCADGSEGLGCVPARLHCRASE
eukprot:CAMPEP_0179344262 /NCGR_PEP_ID=MMETSP0797-20121207/71415_1 /TAXON_ID=47934 /ORGANISM="Dinophysis acuminata, Strain DAEP01" /LENGTH=53 /DNA_ID=CAMNT_0021058669 /DNA_START=36 /DNA_END=194 /DNA_ORIENTATION=+